MEVFFFIEGHESALSIEPVISPIILNMWALHVSDPFISIDALDVLEVINFIKNNILKYKTIKT